MTAEAPAAADVAAKMTDEQKFVFDLKGWLLLPSLLTADQIESIKQHVLTLVHRPDELAPDRRSSYSGPAEILLDHPAIVGILREVLQMPDPTPDCYGFRCENSFPMYRTTGADGLYAHGGGPSMNPLFSYRATGGNIYAGVTRIIWELVDVAKTDGGTLIMSGTHKSAFPVPKSLSEKDSPLFESYECPAGSAIIFSEALCHAGPIWRNPNHPRVGIFNCYNRVDQQYHKLTVPPEVIDALSPRRRTLFRGVWMDELPPGNYNSYFSNSNRAL
jgi:hypothetical protein